MGCYARRGTLLTLKNPSHRPGQVMCDLRAYTKVAALEIATLKGNSPIHENQSANYKRTLLDYWCILCSKKQLVFRPRQTLLYESSADRKASNMKYRVRCSTTGIRA